MITAPPPPTEVSPKEALRYPVVVTVPTSGLTERIVPTLPKWLASMLLLIPLFGLLQLAGATSNDCGEAGELLVDRVNGDPRQLRRITFRRAWSAGRRHRLHRPWRTDLHRSGEWQPPTARACHGAQGQGGVGPPLTTVRATFSSCVDHIEWVAKGTQGFQDEGRSTYGDLNKPVGGGGNMPGFGSDLTPEQTRGDCGLRTGQIWRSSGRRGPSRLRFGRNRRPRREPPRRERLRTPKSPRGRRRRVRSGESGSLVLPVPGRNLLSSFNAVDDVTSEERVETGSAPVIPRARSTQGVICLPARPISGATVTLLRRSPLAPGASSRKTSGGGHAAGSRRARRNAAQVASRQDRPQLESAAIRINTSRSPG